MAATLQVDEARRPFPGVTLNLWDGRNDTEYWRRRIAPGVTLNLWDGRNLVEVTGALDVPE